MELLISQSNGYLHFCSLSVSVAAAVNEFIRTDRTAKAAQISAEGAQLAYPKSIRRLGKILETYDYDYKIIELHGYKKNIDDTMTDFFEDKRPAQITHAVIVVGSMVIDLCRRRMGTHYPLPLSYNFQDVFKYWTGVQDRTHLIQLTSEEIQYRISLLKKGLLKLATDDPENDPGLPNGAQA